MPVGVPFHVHLTEDFNSSPIVKFSHRECNIFEHKFPQTHIRSILGDLCRTVSNYDINSLRSYPLLKPRPIPPALKCACTLFCVFDPHVRVRQSIKFHQRRHNCDVSDTSPDWLMSRCRLLSTARDSPKKIECFVRETWDDGKDRKIDDESEGWALMMSNAIAVSSSLEKIENLILDVEGFSFSGWEMSDH